MTLIYCIRPPWNVTPIYQRIETCLSVMPSFYIIRLTLKKNHGDTVIFKLHDVEKRLTLFLAHPRTGSYNTAIEMNLEMIAEWPVL